MKRFLLMAVLFLGFSNAYAACYDEALSIEENYANCLIEAKRGDASAQFNLGLMYHNGEGVTQDYKEAVKWYRLAAEQGNAAAQYNLGLMYGKGEGITQDYKAAITWYRLAAERIRLVRGSLRSHDLTLFVRL